MFSNSNDGEYNWWAFGVMGGVFPWWAFGIPRKMKREGDRFELHGLCGKVESFTLADVTSVETAKGCCDTVVRVHWTDEAYERFRAQAGCCKCCVGKKYDLACLSTKEFENLVAGFGLDGGAA